jgi:tyrosyl-tRNA synthetase
MVEYYYMFLLKNKKPIVTDEKIIDEVLSRSVEEVIVREELKKRMMKGDRLRVKLGIDPTSPNIHLGRAVQLLKLRDFQELGHDIVLIVGDATGVIGDTSDKDSERPMLSEAVVKNNKKNYFAQAGLLLDLKHAETLSNSKWLDALTYKEIGEHASLFSVSDFIARENIAKRLKEGTRVSLREVLYPLMQGYDSVAVKADIEIGGTDQRFNLLAGRKMQGSFKQRPQDVMMTSIIPGLDGRKMSSSWGNTINLTDTATDMYGKVMSLGDDLVRTYFMHCTRIPVQDIESIMNTVSHPKERKMRLALEITKLYHGIESADKAQKDFEQTFSKGGVPDDVETMMVKIGTEFASIVIEKGLVKSKSEWRRLVDEKAVSFMEGEIISDPYQKVEKSCVLKIGKRRFLKVEVQ